MRNRIDQLLDQANQRLVVLQNYKDQLETSRENLLNCYRNFEIRLHSETRDRYERSCYLEKANERSAQIKTTTADIQTQQDYITKLLAQYNDLLKTEAKINKQAARTSQLGMYTSNNGQTDTAKQEAIQPPRKDM